MGTIYKRGRILWVQYYRNGLKIRESAETSNEAEARNLLKLREGDIARGLPVTNRNQRRTFRELLDDVAADYTLNNRRSLPSLKSRIECHLAPWFGNVRATHVDTARIKQYTAWRRQEGASPATVNRELTVIQRAFELGRQALKIAVPPYVPKLRESNVRRGFFESADLEAICGYLPGYLVAPVRFAFVTGWRVSEIRGLQWRHVDFAAGEIRLDPGTTKNDEGRVFPMTAELRRLLDVLKTPAITEVKQAAVAERVPVHAVSAYTHPCVFVRRLKRSARTYKLGDFRKAWAKACIAAGLPDALFHDFRRTAVRNLVRAGISERVAMAMTGHRTREVFERYNIISPGDLREARQKLDGHKMGTIRAVEAVTA